MNTTTTIGLKLARVVGGGAYRYGGRALELEIRHARVVVTLAEAGSISKAATKLAMPQPSLTSQLRRIEKAVGGDLFVRSSSGITPTALGERLLPMLADLAIRADAVLAEALSSSSRMLRIGNAEWTPVTFRDALQASMPSLDVRTETVDPASGVDAVSRGALDAALLPCPEGVAPANALEPGLTVEVVAREQVWLAVGHQHRLAGTPSLPESILPSLNWVRYARGHWFHPVEEHVFSRFEYGSPEVRHHVGGHAEAMAWVRDAGMAALTPTTGATGDVNLIAVPGIPRSQLILVWRRGALSVSTARVVSEAVRAYYCDYLRSLPTVWSWMTRHSAEFPELARFLSGSNARL